jgi:spermidine synthase
VPETVERLQTPRGELVLRRDGHRYEIISNGVFLMDTGDGRSERLLVRAALDARAGARRLLIGGLGVGFSLAEAVADPGLTAIMVVEREPAVIGWQRTHLSGFSGNALADPRVTVVEADLVDWLDTPTTTGFDAVCLDIDNGPEWTVTDGNTHLYTDAGLSAVRRVLSPTGVLAVWSAAAAPTFEARLRTFFTEVRVHDIEVPRGEPDRVYLAAGPV